MEEARAVLRRLDRIETLERREAPAGVVLDELRGLLRDAEAWLRAEREPLEAVEAVDGCRRALDAPSGEAMLLEG